MRLRNSGNRGCRLGTGTFTATLAAALLMAGGCGDQGLADLLNAFSGDGIVKEPLPPGGEAAAPRAFPESYGVLVGEMLDVPASDGVLANDRSVFALVGFTPISEQGGLIELRLDGGFRYTPPSGFVGSDHFEYDVENDFGVATGRVLLKVLEADSVPVP
jgi:hypothetical protein